MTGNELKKRLKLTGKTQTEIANLLGISLGAFNSSLQVKNVSTAALERICDVLNLQVNFFYEGTQYGIVLSDSDLDMSYLKDIEKENIYMKGKLEGYKEALFLMGIDNKPTRRRITENHNKNYDK